MGRKYLKDIGVKIGKGCVPGSGDISIYTDKRGKVFKKQIKKYGFDARETWNMQFTTACWLYEHLMMFKEKAGRVVDLTYHEFCVILLDEESAEFTVEEYDRYYERLKKYPDDVEFYQTYATSLNEMECIDTMIKYLKCYIKNNRKFKYKEDSRISFLKNLAAEEKAEAAIRIYAEVFPVLWW